MDINTALEILHIVKCDNLGYCRDLSKNPTAQEIGHSIEAVEDHIIKLQDQLLNNK